MVDSQEVLWYFVWTKGMLHEVSDLVLADLGVDAVAVVIGHVGGFPQALVMRVDVKFLL